MARVLKGSRSFTCTPRVHPGLYLTGGQVAEPLWGSTLTPLGTSDSIFLLNQYIYVQLYAAYASIETDVI